MKKLVLFSLLLLACNNDLDLVTDWQDIPVVYAVLSRSDDVHYIRVEKAFLDPVTSALEIAGRPDSLFYQQAVVQLEEVGTGKIFNLERVQYQLPRESGIFAQSPNILYQISSDQLHLQANEEYKLILNRGDNLPLVTAQTTVIGNYQFVQSNPSDPIDWQYNRDVNISWRSDETAAAFFDLNVIIRYRESPSGNSGEWIDKELIWPVVKNLARDERNSIRTAVKVPGIEFYRFIGANLQDFPGGQRIFMGLDLQLLAGGQELFNYINIGQANRGITSAQEIPTYTNLSEGFGVFSSSYEVRKANIGISPTSLDSLQNGQFTKNLNF